MKEEKPESESGLLEDANFSLLATWIDQNGGSSLSSLKLRHGEKLELWVEFDPWNFSTPTFHLTLLFVTIKLFRGLCNYLIMVSWGLFFFFFDKLALKIGLRWHSSSLVINSYNSTHIFRRVISYLEAIRDGRITPRFFFFSLIFMSHKGKVTTLLESQGHEDTE